MLVYKYEFDSSMIDLVKIGRDSGSVIEMSIRHGSMYPYGRVVRECGLEDGDRLMDVMFSWIVGQNLEGQGRMRETKNVLSIACDGVRIALTNQIGGLCETLHSLCMFSTVRKIQYNRCMPNMLQCIEWNMTYCSIWQKWGNCQLAAAKIIDVHTQSEGAASIHLSDIYNCLLLEDINRKCISILKNKCVSLVSLVYACATIGVPYLVLDPILGYTATVFRLLDSKTDILIGSVQYILSYQSVPSLQLMTIQFCKKTSEYYARSVPQPDETMYLIYTSGTTGYPKGSQISYKNMMSYISWHSRVTLSSNCRDTGLLSGSLTFDGNHTMLYWPLIAEGAEVVVLPDGKETDFQYIFDCITDYKIKTAKMVPSYLLH